MPLPYVSKRLHRQIYFTVVACLLAVVVVLGIAAFIADRADLRESPFDTTAQLARLLVPPPDAPLPETEKQIARVGEQIDMDVALYGANKELITAYGPVGRSPRFDRFESDPDDDGWKFGRRGRLIMKLEDGRWLVVNQRHMRPRGRIFGLLIFLGLIGVGIGLGALPFVRRLTSRLQRLQKGVEEMGAGDLSARAPVEGRDEVAQLASSFNEAATKIERLVSANKLLLANASHELRTPLSRIRLGVEMLKKKRTPEREIALEKDIAELDGLIEEILLMSRLDSNTKPKLGDQVDLLALAAEECAHYEECEVTGRSILVDGDARLLRRMLRNLLDNASKHGSLPIAVEITSGASELTLSVADNGLGIAPKDREHVFEPFYRSSGKQNVEGFGLGLALVRQIAEAHGGTVKIAEDQASAMVVNLPVNAVIN